MESMVAVAGIAITLEGVADNATGGGRRVFVGRRKAFCP